ncbi:Lrp/AsnC family transcriptional regulator [Aquitalea sp. LB_tupeE]|uniref:Lrp/AsnC family transcriptional regulator n=1 Tax=Aquitalea sp. LB_tupeE TaxID=2748078 RepID=UPI0015BA6D5D|nr:Lrp/AsnC family transcriptional regulator [Aquitalea sp. LB_tupeE]NWK79544.1 Lrp/AsnC family transcriptional regulator [Aquitalea sp. LB_tupeE]
MRKNIPHSGLDAVDLSILKHLQTDGSMSTPKLAEQLSLSVSPCWRRLKRLEAEGYIRDYQANLDRRKMGLDVMAFVSLSFGNVGDKQPNQFEALIRDHAQVLSCHKITGEADYLLVVLARDLDDYSNFVEQLRAVPGISSIHSNLALKEVKFNSRIPLDM